MAVAIGTGVAETVLGQLRFLDYIWGALPFLPIDSRVNAVPWEIYRAFREIYPGLEIDLPGEVKKCNSPMRNATCNFEIGPFPKHIHNAHCHWVHFLNLSIATRQKNRFPISTSLSQLNNYKRSISNHTHFRQKIIALNRWSLEFRRNIHQHRTLHHSRGRESP